MKTEDKKKAVIRKLRFHHRLKVAGYLLMILTFTAFGLACTESPPMLFACGIISGYAIGRIAELEQRQRNTEAFVRKYVTVQNIQGE
jgi:hypothetical protein